MRLVPAYLLATLSAFSNPVQAQSTTATAPAHYSAGTTPIGSLLDDLAAKAVLLKHIPAIVNNSQIDMARSMTLKGIQSYAGDALNDKVVADIDLDLAKLPVK